MVRSRRPTVADECPAVSPSASRPAAHRPTPPCRRAGLRAVFTVVVAIALTGCEQLGIEAAGAVAARKEADAKAIGAGCRHAARSVEQCFQLNRRADKAAVFAGWREMNDYMRENKIDAVPPSAADGAALADVGDRAAAATADGETPPAAAKGAGAKRAPPH